jgi:DNA repair exonuclease SbcCD ATPase subunit
VLSIGQEASYIRDMLVIHRERCVRDSALVRNGERELISLSETLDGLKELEPLKQRLASTRRQMAEIKSVSAHLQNLQVRAASLVELRKKLAKAQARAEVTSMLPAPERLITLTSNLERARERDRVGRQVLDLAGALSRAKARLASLKALPEAVPALENTSSGQNILGRLEEFRKAAAIAQDRLARIDEGIKSVQADMARLIEDTGGLCPTCGSPVSADSLLDHHAHSPMERLTA